MAQKIQMTKVSNADYYQIDDNAIPKKIFFTYNHKNRDCPSTHRRMHLMHFLTLALTKIQ